MSRRRIIGVVIGLAALLAVAGWANRGALKGWLYEGGGREAWQKPGEVLRALAIPAGAHIADIGAGSGYFTFRFARAAGPAGRVYAVEVDPDMVRLLEQGAQREGLGNVQPMLVPPDDPQLPAGGVDLVFLSNTYHHLENRVDYFRRVRVALRPQGRLAIVEFSGSGWLGQWMRHSTEREVILAELGEAGYRLEQQFDFLPRQHFLIFAAAGPASPSAPR